MSAHKRVSLSCLYSDNVSHHLMLPVGDVYYNFGVKDLEGTSPNLVSEALTSLVLKQHNSRNDFRKFAIRYQLKFKTVQFIYSHISKWYIGHEHKSSWNEILTGCNSK